LGFWELAAASNSSSQQIMLMESVERKKERNTALLVLKLASQDIYDHRFEAGLEFLPARQGRLNEPCNAHR
jgi:hypothetical protein